MKCQMLQLERFKRNLGAKKDLAVCSDISLLKPWKSAFVRRKGLMGKGEMALVKAELIYGSHPQHTEHQGLLRSCAAAISQGKGWMVWF